MGVCNCSMFYCTLLCVHSSIAIILMGKRELVALLNLSSWCLVMVEWLFLTVPWDCLRFVIVVFPDHSHYFLWSAVAGRIFNLCANHTSNSGFDQTLCHAQAIFYALPNNKRGTKYHGFTYSAKQYCP